LAGCVRTLWCSVGTVLEDREAALELRVENLLDTLDRQCTNPLVFCRYSTGGQGGSPGAEGGEPAGHPGQWTGSVLTLWCSVGTVLEDREAALELRVENLLDTLDRLTHNTELRQQQATELIEDLKRANW
jgi:hypothetical protein